MSEKLNKFKKELITLSKKYNILVSASDEGLFFEVNPNKEDFKRSITEIETTPADIWKHKKTLPFKPNLTISLQLLPVGQQNCISLSN